MTTKCKRKVFRICRMVRIIITQLDTACNSAAIHIQTFSQTHVYVESEFHIIGLFCAVCIGGSLLQSRFTARAGRVAQNVEEADRPARRDDFRPAFLRTCAQDESVEHVRLDHTVVYRGGSGVGAQCVGARLREGDVAYVDLHLALAEAVELVNLVLVF